MLARGGEYEGTRVLKQKNFGMCCRFDLYFYNLTFFPQGGDTNVYRTFTYQRFNRVICCLYMVLLNVSLCGAIYQNGRVY